MATRDIILQWISDELQGRLGYSEPSLVQFLSSLARRASSAPEIHSELCKYEMPAALSFAEELFVKYHPPKVSGIRQAARDPGNVNQNAVQEHDDDGGPSHAPQSKALRHMRKLVATRLHGSDSSSDDGAVVVKNLESKRVRKWQEDDEGADNERERQEDQRERELFERRLRAKDKAATRKLVGIKPCCRLKADAKCCPKTEERKEILPMLREASRQVYLKSREQKKLEELRDQVEDEQFLFEGVKLTAKKEEEFRYSKMFLQLASQRMQDVDNVEQYTMPECYDSANGVQQGQRFAVALERCREDGVNEKLNPFAEQEAWEKHQIAKAQLMFGSQDRKPNHGYEYVFKDQVEFIKADLQQGHGYEDGEPQERDTQLALLQLQEGRKMLPIFPFREQLLQAIKHHQVLIVVGETGSGKTSQIPQYLHEAGYTKDGKKVGCTQPRRLAAMSVAARVAEEMGVKLGHEVGYAIRFEDCTSERTVIKYMTDGMLLREFLSEPDLASYSVIMVDEAHERTVSTDVLFGLVKDIIRFRPDIKLLISSATLDACKFSDYFDSAPIFNIPGRHYPVDILYTRAPEADYVEAAVVTVLQIHVTQPLGDILVFFPGQEEIEAAEGILKARIQGLGTQVGEMIICPIHASLPSDLQAKVFENTPEGSRKIVLATNIAETSVTIDGVRYVIDSGFYKQKWYNPCTSMESLLVTPISRAAAQQRAGRAGRTSPGKCFRLYTAWSHQHEMEDNTVPEIQRSNLGNVVLMLKSLGIEDVFHFDFMDPPPLEMLSKAHEQLYALGALNCHVELTKLGRRMAEFPLDPMLSKMIVASDKYKCSEEIVTIAAMLSVGAPIFYRSKDNLLNADNARMNFHTGNVGDHLALLKVYDNWKEANYSVQWCYENYIQARSLKRARDIRDQLEGLLERVEIEPSSNPSDYEAIKKAITAGYFCNTAKLQKFGSYCTVKNRQTVHIHPSSGLCEALPRWVVYFELVITAKEYMRQVIEIKPEWLLEIAPHYYKKQDVDDPGVLKLRTGRACL